MTTVILEDEEMKTVELEQNSGRVNKDISFYVPSDSPARFKTRSERNDLVRICVLSILLSIGYTFNFISVIKLKFNKKQIKIVENIWAIIYLSSVAWLFVSSCVMIIITLVSFTTNKLGFKQSLCKRVLLFSLFTGTCGQITSLIIGRANKKNHKYIFWEFEIIYALLPIYIIILLLLFQKTNARDVKIKILKFAIFSVILFITPFLRLLAIMETSVFSSETTEPLIISAYSAVCAATIVLALVHIIYFLKHYNSGVLIKLIIICLLTYSIIVRSTKKNIKIEFNKYEDIKSKYMEYRVYYYYALEAALYLIYTFEIFIKVPPRYSKNTELLPHILQRSSYLAMKDMTDKKVQAVIKAFPDYKPCEDNKDNYFNEISFDNSSVAQERLKDSIAAIVPFYNESASEIHATLRSLYFNFEYIKQKRSKYQFTHFNVLLVGDGWFKSDISTKRYLTKLYNLTDIDDSFKQANRDIIRSKKEEKEFEEKEPDIDKNKKNKKKKQAYTVILQTKHNKPLCINPFNNGEEDLYMKVTTIIKIDNRKKANSHEWFLGEYGFAEWVRCDYMYFTDAYSTINKEGLYKMVMHMKKPINKDVVCCTGRARVYTIEQEVEFKLLLKEKRSDADCNKKVILPESILYQESKELEQINPGWDAEIFYDARHDTREKRWWQEDKDENVFYRIQDIEYDYRFSVNAHLRKCQMFEFEALYGTIGAYLLGGFLPVIPGPCGFYRSRYVLKDEVRGWYFDKIHQENTWDDMDLVLGNMKLAEDRILTVTSILNCDEAVRHSLLPEVVFYFDPMPSLKQLMKQRRRWINGSIATIIFVLRKISFQTWNVNWFRRIYVLTIWHMQLFMFLVLYLSPPLLFIIAFKYGLATILNELLVDHGEGKKYNYVNTTVTALMIMSWIIYLLFIYFAQSADKKPNKKKRNIDEDEDDCILCCFSCKKKVKIFNCLACDLTVNKDIPEDKKIKWDFKPKIVKLMLSLSYGFGLLTVTGSFVSFGHLLLAITVNTNEIFDNSFNFFVLIIETVFFVQSFILAPLFSKDIKTLEILLKSGVAYFIYAPFYVVFFFINAIANVHDLSWGTRPDDVDAETGNKKAKYTTYGILIILLISNIVMSIVFQPFTEGTYARIIFFAILSLPALFQIFFSLVWLIKERLAETINACLPRKIDEQVDYLTDNQLII